MRVERIFGVAPILASIVFGGQKEVASSVITEGASPFTLNALIVFCLTSDSTWFDSNAPMGKVAISFSSRAKASEKPLLFKSSSSFLASSRVRNGPATIFNTSDWGKANKEGTASNLDQFTCLFFSIEPS